MRAWRRFPLPGFRVRFLTVLVVSGALAAVAILAIDQGSRVQQTRVLAVLEATPNGTRAKSTRALQAQVAVRRQVSLRKVQTFLRSTAATSTAGADARRGLRQDGAVRLYVRPRSRRLFTWTSARTIPDKASARSLASLSAPANTAVVREHRSLLVRLP